MPYCCPRLTTAYSRPSKLRNKSPEHNEKTPPKVALKAAVRIDPYLIDNERGNHNRTIAENLNATYPNKMAMIERSFTTLHKAIKSLNTSRIASLKENYSRYDNKASQALKAIDQISLKLKKTPRYLMVNQFQIKLMQLTIRLICLPYKPSFLTDFNRLESDLKNQCSTLAQNQKELLMDSLSAFKESPIIQATPLFTTILNEAKLKEAKITLQQAEQKEAMTQHHLDPRMSIKASELLNQSIDSSRSESSQVQKQVIITKIQPNRTRPSEPLDALASLSDVEISVNSRRSMSELIPPDDSSETDPLVVIDSTLNTPNPSPIPTLSGGDGAPGRAITPSDTTSNDDGTNFPPNITDSDVRAGSSRSPHNSVVVDSAFNTPNPSPPSTLTKTDTEQPPNDSSLPSNISDKADRLNTLNNRIEDILEVINDYKRYVDENDDLVFEDVTDYEWYSSLDTCLTNIFPIINMIPKIVAKRLLCNQVEAINLLIETNKLVHDKTIEMINLDIKKAEAEQKQFKSEMELDKRNRRASVEEQRGLYDQLYKTSTENSDTTETIEDNIDDLSETIDDLNKSIKLSNDLITDLDHVISNLKQTKVKEHKSFRSKLIHYRNANRVPQSALQWRNKPSKKDSLNVTIQELTSAVSDYNPIPDNDAIKPLIVATLQPITSSLGTIIEAWRHRPKLGEFESRLNTAQSELNGLQNDLSNTHNAQTIDDNITNLANEITQIDQSINDTLTPFNSSFSDCIAVLNRNLTNFTSKEILSEQTSRLETTIKNLIENAIPSY